MKAAHRQLTMPSSDRPLESIRSPVDAEDKRTEKRRSPNAQHLDEAAVDAILADSFPASDPPPWTLGVQ